VACRSEGPLALHAAGRAHALLHHLLESPNRKCCASKPDKCGKKNRRGFVVECALHLHLDVNGDMGTLPNQAPIQLGRLSPIASHGGFYYLDSIQDPK
jgi:hypothetical protein